MGRDRKPLDQHDLAGTRPHYVESQSLVEASRPRIPKEFKTRPEQRKLFKDYCRSLSKRRTLTEGDQELIRLAVHCRVRHARAIEHIELEGEVCKYTRLDSNGQSVDVEKPNLWLKIAQESEKALVGILDRLGLTPTNRNKVKAVERKREKDDDTVCDRAAHAAAQQKRDDDAEDKALLDSIDLDKFTIQETDEKAALLAEADRLLEEV